MWMIFYSSCRGGVRDAGGAGAGYFANLGCAIVLA